LSINNLPFFYISLVKVSKAAKSVCSTAFNRYLAKRDELKMKKQKRTIHENPFTRLFGIALFKLER